MTTDVHLSFLFSIVVVVIEIFFGIIEIKQVDIRKFKMKFSLRDHNGKVIDNDALFKDLSVDNNCIRNMSFIPGCNKKNDNKHSSRPNQKRKKKQSKSTTLDSSSFNYVCDNACFLQLLSWTNSTFTSVFRFCHRSRHLLRHLCEVV